ncbi:uncharacterized protein V6R79_015310 [Siganus canaliculatus]
MNRFRTGGDAIAASRDVGACLCRSWKHGGSAAPRLRAVTEHKQLRVSVHPLVPLLLYSRRLFPQGPGNSQPITAAAAPRGHAHNTGHQGNRAPRQQVKKPLNAFMLYMKEMRHKVVAEGRERESAAINRILGRRWHGLTQSEQSKYYDLAQKERLLHMQLYPGWSARDNYGKKKKRRSQQPSSNQPPSSALLL